MSFDGNMKLTTMLDRENDDIFQEFFNIVSKEHRNEFDFYVNLPKYVRRREVIL